VTLKTRRRSPISTSTSYSDFDDRVHFDSRDSDSDNSDVPEQYNEQREQIAIGMYPICLFHTKVNPAAFNPLMFAMAGAVPPHAAHQTSLDKE
jgi:hypothetical protein